MKPQFKQNWDTLYKSMKTEKNCEQFSHFTNYNFFKFGLKKGSVFFPHINTLRTFRRINCQNWCKRPLSDRKEERRKEIPRDDQGQNKNKLSLVTAGSVTAQPDLLLIAGAVTVATWRHRHARRVSGDLILDGIAPSFPTQPDKWRLRICRIPLNLTEVPSAVPVGLGNTAAAGGYWAVMLQFGAWCGFTSH